jgi:hypothetical protein
MVKRGGVGRRKWGGERPKAGGKGRREKEKKKRKRRRFQCKIPFQT